LAQTDPEIENRQTAKDRANSQGGEESNKELSNQSTGRKKEALKRVVRTAASSDGPKQVTWQRIRGKRGHDAIGLYSKSWGRSKDSQNYKTSRGFNSKTEIMVNEHAEGGKGSRSFFAA